MSGAVLPNGCSRESATKILALYDLRREGGYKNQQIDARHRVRLRSGMTVRDLRRWLAENPAEEDAIAADDPVSEIRATIDYLQTCQNARAAGYPVHMRTDPAWLVNQAINRRAGWLEAPRGDTSRGTSQAIDGHFPRKCGGDWQRHLRLIADEVNTPRLVVRVARLGEHRWLADRIPHRFDNERQVD
jgi:hypothetical protein